jgi:uncharacterized BrkB/YihY/UPF0761 family membrane protein
MGDAIQTPFDVFVFFLVFVGIPALMFGGPIAVLGFLSARRTIPLSRKRINETFDSPQQPEVISLSISRLPWLVALTLLVFVGAIVFLVFGASVHQLLMLD